ncbi:lysophospholipid acyltransferase family protein [Candidatus Omnitrophota bacterium]
MLYWFIRSLAVFLFKIYFREQAFGRENIPLTGGFILAANHASYLDPPVLAAACPRQLAFLAMQKLFEIPLFGRFIRGLNAVPLKTQGAGTQTLRWAVQTLRQGKVITIFPEGSRTADGQMLEPQSGVGFLAARAEAPIVPTYIHGTREAMPMHNKMIWPKKVKVYFGPQIKVENFDSGLSHHDLYTQIAQKVMVEIKKLQAKTKI